MNDDRFPRRILAPDLEEDVACAAATEWPVLIFGNEEIAEWVARLIHDRSGRSAQPFVPYHLTGRDNEDARGFRAVFGQLSDPGTLFVTDLSRAGRETQTALGQIVCSQPAHSLPLRVMGGSSVWLYDAVRAGAFDERVFYCFNRIFVATKSGPRRRSDRLPGHRSDGIERLPGDKPLRGRPITGMYQGV